MKNTHYAAIGLVAILFIALLTMLFYRRPKMKYGEILPSGEMKAKYNLTAEEYKPPHLDPQKVPEQLRNLLQLAAKWGIGDDIIRDDFERKASGDEKQELRNALSGRNAEITQWLNSFEAGKPIPQEAACFMYMQLALDEMEAETGMNKYEYLCSDGGPFIVIPKSLSTKWKGHKINLLDPLNPKTDYGRACSVEGNWGKIKVDNGEALVFADPAMISWKYFEEKGHLEVYVLKMWKTTDMDSLLDQAISNITSDSFKDTAITMSVDDSGLILIYAGDKIGDSMYGESHLAVDPGLYKIHVAHFKNENEEIELYRLMK